MIQEAGGGGVPYDARRSEYKKTYIYYIKCRILQHFLVKLDAGKSDDSKRRANKSLQKVQKVAGGLGEGGAAFEEAMIQIRVQLNLCPTAKQ